MFVGSVKQAITFATEYSMVSFVPDTSRQFGTNDS